MPKQRLKKLHSTTTSLGGILRPVASKPKRKEEEGYFGVGKLRLLHFSRLLRDLLLTTWTRSFEGFFSQVCVLSKTPSDDYNERRQGR